MGVTSVLKGYSHQRKPHVLLRLVVVQMKRYLLKNGFVRVLNVALVCLRGKEIFFLKTF